MPRTLTNPRDPTKMAALRSKLGLLLSGIGVNLDPSQLTEDVALQMQQLEKKLLEGKAKEAKKLADKQKKARKEVNKEIKDLQSEFSGIRDTIETSADQATKLTKSQRVDSEQVTQFEDEITPTAGGGAPTYGGDEGGEAN